MRLIDADKIDGDDCFPGIRDYDIHAKYDFDEYISNQPTVDAVPVIHARWLRTYIIDTDPWYCSNCQNTVSVMGYKRCPYCGAFMNLEVSI
jgi:hypothetical protein